MAGIPGNIASVPFALQASKGAAASASQWALRVQGGSQPHVSPTKADLEETTGLRMLKDSFYSGIQVDGQPSFYCRPEALFPLLYGVLGAKSVTPATVAITSSSVANPSVITTGAPHGLVSGQLVRIAGHSGSTPAINGLVTVTVTDATHFTIPTNVTVGGTGGTVGTYVHSATPAATLPYFTFWRDLGNGLFEKFPDCIITALRIEGGSGMPLLVTPTIVGLGASVLASAEATVGVETLYPFKFDHGAAGYKVANTAIRHMRRIALNIDNGAAVVPGDTLFPYDVTPGRLTVSLEGEMLTEDFAAYKTQVYGSASPSGGTTPVSGPVAVGSPGIDFLWDRASDGRSLQLLLPNVVQDPVDPQPNVSGEPLTQTLTWRAYDASPAITLKVENTTVSY